VQVFELKMQYPEALQAVKATVEHAVVIIN
jgi:hypothetical protein